MVGCKCRCLSQEQLTSISCIEGCSLADLDCLFSRYRRHCQGDGARDCTCFPFSRRSIFLLLLITSIRGRASIFCFYSLSSPRTRNLDALRPSQRPARLNLSCSRGTGDRKVRGLFTVYWKSSFPYSSVKPKAALARSEPTGGRTAWSRLRVRVCMCGL